MTGFISKNPLYKAFQKRTGGNEVYYCCITFFTEPSFILIMFKIFHIDKFISSQSIAKASQQDQIAAHQPQAMLLVLVILLYAVVAEAEVQGQTYEYQVEYAHA